VNAGAALIFLAIGIKSAGAMAHASESPKTSGERWVLALFAIGIFGLFLLDFVADYHPLKTSVAFMLVAWVALLVVHELGHAAAAGLLKWRVCRIVIGYGRTLLRFRFAGTDVQLRLFPAGGYVVPAPRNLESVRMRSSLIYFAGPGSELLVVLGAVALVGFDRITAPPETLTVMAAQCVAIVALLGAGFNLVPLPTDSGAWTDGLGIVKSWTVSRLHFLGRLAIFYEVAAEAALEAGNREAALIAYERGMDEHADNLPLLARLSSGLLDMGAAAGVVKRLEPLLARDDVPDSLQAELLRLLTLALIDLGDASRLDEASEFIEHARERAPGDPSLLVAQAELWVELRRFHPALELIDQAEQASHDPAQRDECTLCRALADARRGNRSAARDAIEPLLARGMRGRLVRRVLEELGPVRRPDEPASP
jgi:hypothetical protein